MALTCKKLLGKHEAAWESAVHHPFLDQCGSGEIRPEQFNTWLVQDYLFVLEFTRMAACVLAAAPVAHMDGLLGGLGALKDELAWFREKAQERDLDLGAVPQPACEAYRAFMREFQGVPYAVQAVAFWAIEAAYNEGWQGAGPMSEPYTEFADRWGNPLFTEYVELLAGQADEVLAGTDEATRLDAEKAFLRVASLEQRFWQMAFEGG